MARGYVLRCPECGSTDVWCDESRSVVDISCFCCRGCGNEEYCDSWERDWDWKAEVELEADGTAPARVEPLAADKRFHTIDKPTD